MAERNKKVYRAGTHVLRPKDMQRRWGHSKPTVWRMEKDGRLPPRDAFDALGQPVGWLVSTIERVERGESAAA